MSVNLARCSRHPRERYLNDAIDQDGLSIKNRIANFIGWKDSKSKGKFVKKSDNDEMN